MNRTETWKNLFNQLTAQMSADLEKISTGMLRMYLPFIPQSDICYLCQDVGKLFSSEPILLQIHKPVKIIGDLHGHYLDLLRILHDIGPIKTQKLLFLGDLVDRGEFSLETVVLVFVLKMLYPKNVFLIRGNHEFEFLCNRCGFASELTKIYNPPNIVFNQFLMAFSQIPIGALVDEKILCVHGGIGPMLQSISQICEFNRPIDEFVEGTLDCVLWSDPSDKIEEYEPSNRGTGYFFGPVALNTFLEQNSLTTLIRAHECVDSGCKFMFNDTLVTVFSASNYCGLVGNQAAYLVIDCHGKMIPVQFPPFAYLKRENIIIMRKEQPLEFHKRADISSASTVTLLKSPVIIRPTSIVTPDPKRAGKKNPMIKSEPKCGSSLFNSSTNLSDAKSKVRKPLSKF